MPLPETTSNLDQEPRGKLSSLGPERDQSRPQRFPTVHVISDSVGDTAQVVARAAAAQFGVTNPRIEVYSMVKRFEEVRDYLTEHVEHHKEVLGDERILVFYTLVHSDMRDEMVRFLETRPEILGVDLISQAIAAIANLSGLMPANSPGRLRAVDSNYFKRIAAIEFTIAHDDGRNPEDLTQADIVLFGVSRSSKTPLSIYLAQQGFKVANVPVDPSTDPPAQLFEVDRTRLFGLMTTPEVLIDIRRKRMQKAGRVQLVAQDYANPEFIYQDLESARALMRRLGCIVIHTEKRAVEETAQEILRYYERSHPMPSDILE